MAAPYGNKNAEKWSIKRAINLFNDAIELTNETTIQTLIKGVEKREVEGYEFDFIGEVARELGTFHEIFRHLIKRFPSLSRKYNVLINNLEQNCYSNTKKGFIREATGIVNLKSNHKWTDRQDLTSGDKELKSLTEEKREERIRELKDKLGIK